MGSAQAAHREAMAAHEETKVILQVWVRVRVRVRVGDMTRQDTPKTQNQNVGKKKRKQNRSGQKLSKKRTVPVSPHLLLLNHFSFCLFSQLFFPPAQNLLFILILWDWLEKLFGFLSFSFVFDVFYLLIFFFWC